MTLRDLKLRDLSMVCSEASDSRILKNILDSMSDSLIVLGPQGDILYTNRITEQILGYTFAEFAEKGIGLLFFTREENREFNQLFVDAITERSVNRYSEVEYFRPDGSLRKLACTTSYLIVDEEQTRPVVGFVAIFKDITEISNLRLQEQKLIQDKLTSLNKLAMGVAHEIRNPVVTIGGFASRIAREQVNPLSTRQYAQNILADARRLEAVVEEVQNFCDLPPVRLLKGKVSGTVVEAIQRVTPRAEPRGITISLENSMPENTAVAFDPTLIRIAVEKILENAIDFSPDGGAIQVNISGRKDAATIEVVDHGRGISERDLQFVFDPFFSTKTFAAGMGLAVVDRIVRDHLGRLELHSTRGSGTTVRVELS